MSGTAEEYRKNFNAAEHFAEAVIDDSFDTSICVSGTVVDADAISQELAFLTDSTIEVLTSIEK